MPFNGTLYVFVHGLSVGCEITGNIEIVLPRLPGHVCRAGSWLMETDIAPKSTLRLWGVTPGNATLAASDPTIHLVGCSLTRRGRAATLWLPPPKDILELLISEDPNLVTIVGGGVTFPGGGNIITRVASIMVLVYDYPDENDLYLENHYWEPCSTGGATSLHIISTSVGPEGADHIYDTDNALRKVVHNYPGLTFARPPRHLAPTWNETGSPRYGDLHGLSASGEYIVNGGGNFAFAQAELEAIPSRTVRIGRLGRLKQHDLPIQDLWHEPDPLFDTQCDCGHHHVG